MPTPQRKAAGLNSTVAVVRQMVTKEEFDRFVASLPPHCSALIMYSPLAISWLPMSDSVDLHQHIFTDLFNNSLERMFELGRRQFLSDMNTIYRIFMRIASPSFVATRAASIYELYSRDAATMRIVREEPRAIEIAIEEHPFPEASNWAFLRGTIQGVIEATGVKNVKVKDHRRRRQQPPMLLDRATWE